MIKRIGFYPQYAVEETQFDNTFAVISITDPASEAKIQGTNSLLRLEFLDIEDPVSAGFDQEMIDAGIVFNSTMATQVIEFLNSIQQDSIDTLVIHCKMGVSRSAAVALCAYHYLKQHNLIDEGVEFEQLFQTNYANKLVVENFQQFIEKPIDIPTKEEARESMENMIIGIHRMFKSNKKAIQP